jgi:hypothetical protein
MLAVELPQQGGIGFIHLGVRGGREGYLPASRRWD